MFACISLMPIFIFGLGVNDLQYVIATIVLNQVFCYCATIICYALIVRGVRNKLSADEIMGGTCLIGVLSLGLYNCNIGTFMPYFLLLGWIILVSTHSFSLNTGCLVCFAVAFGGSAGSRSLALCGSAITMYTVAYAFKKLSVWFSLFAVMLIDLLAGAFFSAYDYNILHIVAIFSGGFIFAILPKKVKAKIPVYINENGTASAKQLINHNRSEIFARLTSVSKVFFEMGDCFGYNPSNTFNDLSPQQVLSRDIMLKVCSVCTNREYCQSALGSDTSVMFEGIASTALTGKHPGIEDLPTFITARCKNIPLLLSTCTQSTRQYNERLQNEKQYELSQQIIAEQMYGIGKMISLLADDINKGINFDTTLESKIIEELGYCNIVCTEAVMFSKDGELNLSITVRTDDANKYTLDEIINKVLKCKMRRVGGLQPISNNKTAISFCAQPRYCAVYGQASVSKDKNADNGDSKSVQRLGNDKLFVAICDGMGSGKHAQDNSISTLNMVENFYKAGFDGNAVLKMINRLLMLRSKESFSALDMCIIDLKRAMAHFVKLGGVQSFIKRDSNVEVINSGALPIGIVEEATPFTDNKLLAPGNIVVLVSDGITDSLGADGISLLLSRTDSCNPQEVCDMITAQATKYGAKDDSTVVAIKLT